MLYDITPETQIRAHLYTIVYAMEPQLCVCSLTQSLEVITFLLPYWNLWLRSLVWETGRWSVFPFICVDKPVFGLGPWGLSLSSSPNGELVHFSTKSGLEDIEALLVLPLWGRKPHQLSERFPTPLSKEGGWQVLAWVSAQGASVINFLVREPNVTALLGLLTVKKPAALREIKETEQAQRNFVLQSLRPKLI